MAYDFCQRKADGFGQVALASSKMIQMYASVRPPSVHPPNRLGTPHIGVKTCQNLSNSQIEGHTLSLIERSPTLIPFRLWSAERFSLTNCPMILGTDTQAVSRYYFLAIPILVLVASGCIFPCGIATVYRQAIPANSCMHGYHLRMMHTNMFKYNGTISTHQYPLTQEPVCQGLAPSS